MDSKQEVNLETDSKNVPYKEGSTWSKLRYFFKSFFVTNPRLLSLFLLFKSTWPRALALVDMFTDIQVTIDLYKAKYVELFCLSVLFMSFSFIMLWSVSLRYVESYMNQHKEIIASTKWSKFLINTLLLLYLFPPFGCLVASFFEIYYIVYDVYLGIYSFIKGEILIVDKDAKKAAFKRFRRIVVFFGESIPEVLMQTYMFIYKIDVNSTDLYISICVSVFHLCFHCYKLGREAKYHGMTFAQYSINVLHLGMFCFNLMFVRIKI